ncbi:phosphatidylethanolamine-binding protein [Gordonibacter sp. An230]|uniref:YbhB/YbcL family Raf kinase inhibitor-like protein n=1 Tax=Gordonibacter sp. An230 TaxID=1965592 RepID=UPI000B389C25|nr:YbhB/YbcL family Raf kinase inhibitor-like protein [Gordonibacter sp. An230]OUO91704.1 phosphatidylethanolamine-binding protein [Gordonibacter sp. An230]
MKAKSEGIVNGVIDDRYGKRGEVNGFGMPVLSPPLEFVDAPAETQSFAVFIEDKDAYPVSGGFSWVHWMAANIESPLLSEDASRNPGNMVQGANSWMSAQGGSNPPELCSCYGGMAPPDKEHLYEIHVYALDTVLDLKNGFHLNELFRAMEGHVLDQTTLKGRYSA